MSQNMLSLLMQGSAAPTYVDDVFSAYTYTGNQSTLTITNGIDLAGKGGLVWIKGRSVAYNNFLSDTTNGATKSLRSNTTDSLVTNANTTTSFNSDGFSMGSGDTSGSQINTSPQTFVSWTFRKAAKFFDIVTWTGNSTAGREIAHSLGQTPGMIIVKMLTDAGYNWIVWHRSLATGEYLLLNTTNAIQGPSTSVFGNNTISIQPTSSVFTLGTSSSVNLDTKSYVAYLFSHDTATDGLIQCGTFTTNGSGAASVSLGWEPQFVITKTSATVDNWCTGDVSRGMDQANIARLIPNLADAEGSITSYVTTPTATGFDAKAFSASTAYVYLAIRRPNKPPTVGTQVYNAIARTGTGAAATVTGVGFAPDLVMSVDRPATYNTGKWFYDRLRGALLAVFSSATSAEASNPGSITSFDMDGFSTTTSSTTNTNTGSYINWCFKRAPGVFDEVCYTGTGSATTQAHSLGVAPELMIVKGRSVITNWPVYSGDNTKYLKLESAAAIVTDSTAWNNTSPTSSVFSLGSLNSVDYPGGTFVAYLFATKAGISKVGSYTGDGTTGQTINCGFTTGARFVLIKRTDSTGDWFVWDSTRGIVAGNDPHLSLNTTSAEVTTDDSVDTDNSGFIVNQVAATNVNVNTATYIYLAFA